MLDIVIELFYTLRTCLYNSSNVIIDKTTSIHFIAKHIHNSVSIILELTDFILSLEMLKSMN